MSSSIDKALAADIRKWNFSQRLALHTGPPIRIFCGDVLVVELPRRMFAAVSTLSALHDPSNAVTELHLPINIDTEFFSHIMAWLLKRCLVDIKMRNLKAPKSVWGDLNVLRAGRLLGMEK